MADADEDAIPSTSVPGTEDFEDEAQDFRFLTQITASTTSGDVAIPKRGTKDFEPNPSRSQAAALDASRLAMHNALSSVRTHSGKNHLLGQYLPREDDWKWDDNGAGVRHGRCVVVYKFKSTFASVMGRADRNNWTWLLPEEALYLLERGSLDIRWPDVDDDGHSEGASAVPGAGASEQEGQKEERSNQHVPESTVDRLPDSMPAVGRLPMSLQGAYASLIDKDGLTLERYSIYAGLKRAGYIVQRAPTWHDADPEPVNGHANTSPLTGSSSLSPIRPNSCRALTNGATSLIRWLISWLIHVRRGEACPSFGPLVAPGLYRNYADIFRALAMIPYYEPPSNAAAADMSPPQPLGRNPQPPFRVHFHVWKPIATHGYRKSAPAAPDYRICVVDARTTTVPSLTQISELLESQPEDVLLKGQPGGGRLETRIKHGRRNVILAVVDMGVVSYLRISDACFAAEKLYEEKGRAAPKGGTKYRPRNGKKAKPGK